MSLALTTDILLKSVGKPVMNTKGVSLGRIVEITRDTSGFSIEYAILRSDQKGRHFAIPASSKLMKITEAGEIILQISEKDFELATGIQSKKCPSPNFNSEPSIFELMEYDGPETK